MTAASRFSIAIGSSEPIYRQLVSQVRRRVAAGNLKAGDELPSVRSVARSLAINPMTVSKAFGILEDEGLLTRRRGLAMVVADRHRIAQSASVRLTQLRPSLEIAAREAHQLRVRPADAVSLFKNILS